MLYWQRTYWAADRYVPCCTEEQIQDWNSRKQDNVNSLSQDCKNEHCLSMSVNASSVWPDLRLWFHLTWILLESCPWWWAAQTADRPDKLSTPWPDCCQSGCFSSESWRTGGLRGTLGLQVVWPDDIVKVIQSHWNITCCSIAFPSVEKEETLALTIISVAKTHSDDFLFRFSSASSKGSLKLLMQLQVIITFIAVCLPRDY